MPKKSLPYGFGVQSDLLAAIQRAAELQPGETIVIPTDSETDADKVRRYFLRERARVIKEAISSGVTSDVSEADLWTGVITSIVNEPCTGVEFKRPRKLDFVWFKADDGSWQKETV